MPAKKKTTKGKGSKRTKSKRPTIPHVYRMPKRADELNITCAECGGEAAYFDEARVSRALYATEKARDEHMRGFICENEPRSAKAQRLLVLAEGELMPIPDDNAAAPIITASQV